MPARNSRKQYIPESYYHIYNRGVAKQTIFEDKQDYVVFLSLFKRHLSKEPSVDKYGRSHPHYRNDIELLAFCLMSNHFHFLIYQDKDDRAMTKFVQSLCTAYTMYFNRKRKRVGPLFEGRFKASRITKDQYLQHISRYIHLNPAKYQTYEWSSLQYYHKKLRPEWIQPRRILELFKNSRDYMDFLEDYTDYKSSLDEIKHELANSPPSARLGPARD